MDLETVIFIDAGKELNHARKRLGKVVLGGERGGEIRIVKRTQERTYLGTRIPKEKGGREETTGVPDRKVKPFGRALSSDFR